MARHSQAELLVVATGWLGLRGRSRRQGYGETGCAEPVYAMANSRGLKFDSWVGWDGSVKSVVTATGVCVSLFGIYHGRLLSASLSAA